MLSTEAKNILSDLELDSEDESGGFFSLTLYSYKTASLAAVGPQFNEVLRDWGNWFVMLRVNCINY